MRGVVYIYFVFVSLHLCVRFFFFKQKTAYEMRISDWSSDVCSSDLASLKATLHEIEASISIQNEGFANLILGSQVSMEELLNRAPENWYLEASEAQALGLIAAVI